MAYGLPSWLEHLPLARQRKIALSIYVGCAAIVLVPLAIALLIGSGTDGSASHAEDASFLVNAFEQKAGYRTRKWTETSFTKGTSDSRAAGWIDDVRRPTSLGCFHLIGQATGDTSEQEMDMCILYVDGPPGTGGKIWWRGNRSMLDGILADLKFQQG